MFFVRQSSTEFQPPLRNRTADIFLLLICATAVKMRDFGKMPVSFLRFLSQSEGAYLDLFNNEIVEWELSDTFDNFLVMRPAERLLKRKMSTEHQVLLHSDQGVQYSSAGYCNLLKKYNVIQSMSRAGTPHDNAVMESFWGRFKDTLRKHFRYWESDDLRSTIEQAIYYFNNERPVRKLKGKPPVLYRTELAA